MKNTAVRNTLGAVSRVGGAAILRKCVFTLVLYVASVAAAHATIFTDRDLFESVINVVYTETFESLAGTTGGLGAVVTLPTGLTAVAQSADGSEVTIATPGEFLNPSIAVGVQQGSNAGAIQFELGQGFQAVGFDYFATEGPTNDFSTVLGRGGTPGLIGIDTLVAAFASALTTRDDLPDFPETGFLGFINDGNPFDVFDTWNFGDPLQGNVYWGNVEDSGFIDRLFVETFDSPGSPFIDNITVGFLASNEPVLIPEPSTGVLLIAGLLGVSLARRRGRGRGLYR